MEEQDPDQPFVSPRRQRWRREMYTLVIVSLLGAVVAGFLLASSIWEWKRKVAPPSAPAAASVGMTADQACGLQKTFDAIKQDLFDRAAEKHGGDGPAFQRVANFSLLQVQDPFVRQFDQQSQRIDCSGTAVLELPPQITAASGVGTLTAPIDYFIQPGANGGPAVLSLGNVDVITVPLSTIALTSATMTMPSPPPTSNAQAANQAGAEQDLNSEMNAGNASGPPAVENEIEPLPSGEEPGSQLNHSEGEHTPPVSREEPDTPTQSDAPSS